MYENEVIMIVMIIIAVVRESLQLRKINLVIILLVKEATHFY